MIQDDTGIVLIPTKRPRQDRPTQHGRTPSDGPLCRRTTLWSAAARRRFVSFSSLKAGNERLCTGVGPPHLFFDPLCVKLHLHGKERRSSHKLRNLSCSRRAGIIYG